MAKDVIIPALGMAQDTGKVLEWLRAEGQMVTAGEPLVTIETDKAAVDLEAPASGILARISAQPGDEVPVAQVIAVILTPEEAAHERSGAPPDPGMPATRAAPTAANGAPTAQSATPALARAQPDGPPDGPEEFEAPARPPATGRRLASPKARRLAAERGLDIAALRGTGPGGVVLSADVLAARAMLPDAPAAALEDGAAPDGLAPASAALAGAAAATAPGTVWRLMAERTTQSWRSAPHFFLVREVAAEALVAWRAQLAAAAQREVTYTDLLVKVVAEALRRHPRLNASWQGGGIVEHAEINIGLAVAVEDGLVAPVIHQADDLTLGGIARRRADLVARAQAGRLRPRDLADGTFTISNLGMYGVDAFTAIIVPPQAGILAVGRLAERVVPLDGKPAVRPMVTLSLSCDHRIVDGARAARFLGTLAELIEGAWRPVE